MPQLRGAAELSFRCAGVADEVDLGLDELGNLVPNDGKHWTRCFPPISIGRPRFDLIGLSERSFWLVFFPFLGRSRLSAL